MMRPLRMGLIGGGPGAFIGPVHRIAAELDGAIRMVAGAFSSDPARSVAAGRPYAIDPARAYPDFTEMLRAERARPDPIDLVVIATPNHAHLPAAAAALQAGFAVMSDKPATATLAEARSLSAIVARLGGTYALSYTYTGYPMVREARARVAAGAIGAVRKIVAEYPQGWLASPIERSDNRQAAWRVDPARAGAGGCIADIGVHAFNLCEFVSGRRVVRLLADLAAVVPGRVLDDDVAVLLRLDNGARGVLMASQISVGELNGLRLRIYGETGSLDWQQEQPNRLVQHHLDGRSEIVRTGDAACSDMAKAATRLPGGHPEGYLEAFANLYREFAVQIGGGARSPAIQGIAEGVRGMAFIEASVACSANGGGWIAFAPD